MSSSSVKASGKFSMVSFTLSFCNIAFFCKNSNYPFNFGMAEFEKWSWNQVYLLPPFLFEIFSLKTHITLNDNT